ncbi:MAG: aromatic ring-hydroxylating dioxygenase subunit alpha [Spongiibacteraceae bacterium]|jgi:vanillate O-demethylase monooxygenase subunit|nr:aromatic ring-hydroxylating dioxygenase subunit alpha [Spongiibacteraceae bacterium]
MFVRNCWYVASWSSELSAEQPLQRWIIGEPVVLYRDAQGAPVALEDRCCHRAAPLSRGRIEGSDLRCMYHGLKFDSAGSCVDAPGFARIPGTLRVRSYPVAERHGWIWVWMGVADQADPDLIPPAIGLDDPAWCMAGDSMDYQANYLLINDNLTDFSHLAYVHIDSFGGGEEQRLAMFAQTRSKTTRLPRGVRVQRWVKNRQGGMRSREAHCDAWMTYDYLAPGVLLMRSAEYPVGTADHCGDADMTPPADIEPLHENFTSQCVTPMTRDTTRYYFAWGPRAREESAESMRDIMAQLAIKAFTEDREMIEAQQVILNATPEVRMHPSPHDTGPNLMRSVLQQLMDEEQRAAEPAVQMQTVS